MMLCSILYKVVILLYFLLALPVSVFFLVFFLKYYFDCVDTMLPRHILISDGATNEVSYGFDVGRVFI